MTIFSFPTYVTVVHFGSKSSIIVQGNGLCIAGRTKVKNLLRALLYTLCREYVCFKR
jgi:hypothetical protein